MNCEVVSMDFIFGLTPFNHVSDAICMCVETLSKMTHFMPITTHVIVEGMARLFCDQLY